MRRNWLSHNIKGHASVVAEHSKKMKFILASLSIGVMCLTANAQQAAWVFGYGNATCSTWILERRAASYSPVALHAWITGYLSGVGMIGSPTLRADSTTPLLMAGSIITAPVTSLPR